MFHRPDGEGDDNDFAAPSRIRAYSSLRRAIWLARRTIVAAKLYRPWSELICRPGVSEDYATLLADAPRGPQVPLILGDKWDL